MNEDRFEKELTLQIANQLKIILNVKEGQKQRLEAFTALDTTTRQFSPDLAKKLYEKLRVTLEQLLQDRNQTSKSLGILGSVLALDDSTHYQSWLLSCLDKYGKSKDQESKKLYEQYLLILKESFVDLLVGIYLELAFDDQVIPILLEIIQNCRPLWQQNKKFTLGLLDNFLEDLKGIVPAEHKNKRNNRSNQSQVTTLFRLYRHVCASADKELFESDVKATQEQLKTAFLLLDQFRTNFSSSIEWMYEGNLTLLLTSSSVIDLTNVVFDVCKMQIESMLLADTSLVIMNGWFAVLGTCLSLLPKHHNLGIICKALSLHNQFFDKVPEKDKLLWFSEYLQLSGVSSLLGAIDLVYFSFAINSSEGQSTCEQVFALTMSEFFTTSCDSTLKLSALKALTKLLMSELASAMSDPRIDNYKKFVNCLYLVRKTFAAMEDCHSADYVTALQDMVKALTVWEDKFSSTQADLSDHLFGHKIKNCQQQFLRTLSRLHLLHTSQPTETEESLTAKFKHTGAFLMKTFKIFGTESAVVAEHSRAFKTLREFLTLWAQKLSENAVSIEKMLPISWFDAAYILCHIIFPAGMSENLIVRKFALDGLHDLLIRYRSQCLQLHISLFENSQFCRLSYIQALVLGYRFLASRLMDETATQLSKLCQKMFEEISSIFLMDGIHHQLDMDILKSKEFSAKSSTFPVLDIPHKLSSIEAILTYFANEKVFKTTLEVLSQKTSKTSLEMDQIIFDKKKRDLKYGILHWYMSSLATYFVHTRLRTPIGNPAQNFEFILNMLSANISHALYNLGFSGVNKPQSESKFDSEVALALLFFVAELERQIQYWQEYGSMINSTSKINPRATALFFRANRKVCSELFMRLRNNLLLLSHLLSVHQESIRHGSSHYRVMMVSCQNSKDLKKSLAEIEVVVIMTSIAAWESREFSWLQGFLHLVKDQSNTIMSQSKPENAEFFQWIPALTMQSKQNFELASIEYQKILKNENLSAFGIYFVLAQLGACHLALNDANGLSQWRDTVAETKQSKLKMPDAIQLLASYPLYGFLLERYLKQLSGDIARTPISYASLYVQPSDMENARNLLPLPPLNQIFQFFNLTEDRERQIQDKFTSADDWRKLSDFSTLLFSVKGSEIQPNIPSLTNILRQDTLEPENSHINWPKLTNIFKEKLRVSSSQIWKDAELLSVVVAERILVLHGNFKRAEELLADAGKTVFQNTDENWRKIGLAMLKYEEYQKNLESVKAAPDAIPWEFWQKLISGMEHLVLDVVPLVPKVSDSVTNFLSCQLLCQLHLCIYSASQHHTPKLEELISQSKLPKVFQLSATKEKNELPVDHLSRPWESHAGNLLFLAQQLPDMDVKSCKLFADWCFQVSQTEAKNNLVGPVFFRKSFESYVRYLALTEKSAPSKYQKSVTKLSVVLRLLKFVTTRNEDLEGIDLSQAAQYSVGCWKTILPQLFAHLKSTENLTVRKFLKHVITAIGEQFPDLILFPVMATLQQEKHTKKFKMSESSESAMTHNNSLSVVMQELFIFMKKNFPDLTEETKILVKELHRITFLSHDIAIHSLQKLKHEIEFAISSFKHEVQEFEKNKEESKKNANVKEKRHEIMLQKYELVTSPIVITLDKLIGKVIGKPPKTPHETWFQNTFSKDFKELIQDLKKQIEHYTTKKTKNWNVFIKDLLRPLQITSESVEVLLKKLSETWQHSQDHSNPNQNALGMSKISPKLSCEAFLALPLPGLSLFSQHSFKHDPHFTTVQSVTDHVTVLPTKTRPKKLLLTGSDGRQYSFLLKGGEDLRLDERMIQVISAANTILEGTGLRTRTYAVLPLGTRVGLIQWVPGVRPLFSLVKEKAKAHKIADVDIHQQVLTQNPNNNATTSQLTSHFYDDIQKPNEAFLKKLMPALKHKGLQSVAHKRSEWPKEVLTNVFQELRESARGLRNLLPETFLHVHHASHFSDWLENSRNFSASAAAMSMLGYVIGLGDRHLDNILVDLSSCELLHIDFNVCFEKGTKLKVPELVPFRLTDVIQDALGFGGLSGSFKSNCATVMEALRNHKDVILELLEVFVYDPLIEWTPRREEEDVAELDATLNVFLSRFQELKTEFLTNPGKIAGELEKTADLYGKYYVLKDPHGLNTNGGLTPTKKKSQKKTRTDQENARNLLKDMEGKFLFAKQDLEQDLKIFLKNCDEMFSFAQSLIKLSHPLVSYRELHKAAKIVHLKILSLNEEFTIFTSTFTSFEEPNFAVKKSETLKSAIQSTTESIFALVSVTKADKKPPPKVELTNSDKSEVETTSEMEEDKLSNSLSQSDTVPETKESEPNNYAFNVLSRIRAKLEGTETKDGKLSVEKQVLKLIDESTDVGNLAFMYEGWTAWL